MLRWILVATVAISLIACIGSLTLFVKRRLLDKFLLFFVAFSAGALLGGAFLHLLPEAIQKAGLSLAIFGWLLVGFCTFFILEQFIHWHHHHATAHPEIKPFSYLILLGDGIHNFIDGLVIAASFIISWPLGLTTSIAVALHEIPQEIGDFGVLLYGGFERIKALLFNWISAIIVVFGGITGWFLSSIIGSSILFLLPFAAGNFIYIASSDLIPEIKGKGKLKRTSFHFLAFLLGIGLMFFFALL